MLVTASRVFFLAGCDDLGVPPDWIGHRQFGFFGFWVS